MRRKLIYHRITPFTPSQCWVVVICGISVRFRSLFPCDRQIAHALLTRPPLTRFGASTSPHSFDLHVLSTPPAFVLSQDQTLMFVNTWPLDFVFVTKNFNCAVSVSSSPKIRIFGDPIKLWVYCFCSLTSLFNQHDSLRYLLTFCKCCISSC